MGMVSESGEGFPFVIGDVVDMREYGFGPPVVNDQGEVLGHVLVSRDKSSAGMSREQAERVTPALFQRRDWRDHAEMVATCDWGHCDAPTVGVRWSGPDGWLSVCEDHSRSEEQKRVLARSST